jgi:hypothetical protein
VNCFGNLFTVGGVEVVEECLAVVHGWVTAAMNETLMQPFTEEEIRVALFQMAPLKASGPNRLNVGFSKVIRLLLAQRFTTLYFIFQTVVL